jgi:hypothetical protein
MRLLSLGIDINKITRKLAINLYDIIKSHFNNSGLTYSLIFDGKYDGKYDENLWSKYGF